MMGHQLVSSKGQKDIICPAPHALSLALKKNTFSPDVICVIPIQSISEFYLHTDPRPTARGADLAIKAGGAKSLHIFTYKTVPINIINEIS